MAEGDSWVAAPSFAEAALFVLFASRRSQLDFSRDPGLVSVAWLLRYVFIRQAGILRSSCGMTRVALESFEKGGDGRLISPRLMSRCEAIVRLVKSVNRKVRRRMVTWEAS